MDPYLYQFYYVNALLCVTLMIWFLYSSGVSRITLQEGTNSFAIWILTLAIIVYIGTRPISGAFVDMPIYAEAFNMAKDRGRTFFESDWFFSWLLTFHAEYFSVETLFLTCAALYVAPLTLAAKRRHGNWGFAVFLSFVGAFSFFSYGVNGIRHGLAASLTIAAMAYADKKIWFILFSVLAVGMHKSMALPIAAFLLTYFLSNPGIYASLWAICLTLNLIFGENLSVIIGSILPVSGEDSRSVSYFGVLGQDRGGFRFDFILYSIVPIIISHFFADSKTRSDRFYRRLLSCYILANAFWILTMYAAFSNRFAYLSWFLLPWVIIAPHLNNVIDRVSVNNYPRSPALIGLALVAHFSFTYIMFTFVYN